MRNLPAPLRDDIQDFRTAIGSRPLVTRAVLQGYEIRIQAAYESYGGNITTILGLEPMPLDDPNHSRLFRENYSSVYAGRSLADLGAILHESAEFRCPICNFEQTSTLDHFLAKSTFPEFSILARNLVASCFNCNHKKGVHPATDFIHAYFDHLPNVQMLFAHIFWNPEIAVTFSVEEMGGIDHELFLRLQSQFNHLELPDRFAREAVYVLAEIRPNCAAPYARGGLALVRSELQQQANIAEAAYGVNHYKPSLLRALAADQHFCDGGFQLPPSQPQN